MKCQLRSLLITLFFVVFGLQSSIYAHEPDHSYLFLRVEQDAIKGRVETAFEDLNEALGLSLDTALRDESLSAHLPAIRSYLLDRVSFRSELGAHRMNFSDSEILWLDDSDDFIALHFDLQDVGDIPDNLDIQFEPFFDINNLQRGVLIVEHNWKAGILNNHTMISNIFQRSKATQQLSLTDASLFKGFIALVKLGMWHIWIGLDHILFILALILPSVVRRRNDQLDMSTVTTDVSANYSKSWLPVARFKPAFWYIIKIITFFTIAHSITLALAALNVVNLNSRMVESIIALSIALAALHNITPIFKGKEWMIAFGFGLFHGFGFASVLGEKGLSGDYLVLSLLGFNVGVEIGQVLIICLIFPFLFLLRKQNIYPKILKYGSLLLILLSLHWVVERAFDVNFKVIKHIKNLFGM